LCAIAFVIWCAVPIVSDEFRRVEVGYLGGAALLCLFLSLLYRRPLDSGDTIAPGSSEEMELRLAAADEGSP
jgi:hypothetical protein